MRLTFVHLSEFVSKWKQFRLNDDDLQKLERELTENPALGDVIRGGGVHPRKD